MTALGLKITFLTGRCVASAYNDREQAEWPPHPARVYSALVAAWAESQEQCAVERSALEWFAALGPPSVYASEAGRRQVVPYFVPVNDVAVLDEFEGSRGELVDRGQAYEGANAEYEKARLSGNGKMVEKAQKALAKAERAHGAARDKVSARLIQDQEPYAAGKHPDTALKDAWAMLPEHRGKQPRSFPSVSPDDPRVFLRWRAEPKDIETHRSALATLAARVVRIGHSTSLVACAVVDDGPMPSWEPDEQGNEVFRVPGADQLAQLVEAFERHREIEPRVLPCRFQRYRKVGVARTEATATSLFSDDWIAFRQVSGRRLQQTCGVEVARALRGALLKYADDPPPELLSGHAESGEPSASPHMAIVPLPFIGSMHASGDLLGLSLVFPRQADDGQRQAVLRAIGLWEKERRAANDDTLVDTPPLELMLGRAGVIALERIEWGIAPLKTLRSATWCRSSRVWLTGTPIALDRNPGDLFSREPEKATAAYAAAERSIATACERIGLPTPSYVQLHPSVPLRGVAKARAYPTYPPDPTRQQRVKVHARIEFPVSVRGPVLLGAGRYFGLGLCLPQPEEGRFES